MTDPFAGLEPTAFWRHFEALTRIARPTFEEERAAAHVVAWAGGRGFKTRRDGAGNVVVDVPATPGREHAPTVILQGHLDMVCERDPGSPYDPREGRIGVLRDGDWLLADGTTLGADDGVAIAAMLALADDAAAPHGPLELLMTVAEEVGMEGAAALAPELITGTVLLNLDSEEDGTLTVGCAGGADSILRLDAPRDPVGSDDVALRVTVGGGRGGHSGAARAYEKTDPAVRVVVAGGGAEGAAPEIADHLAAGAVDAPADAWRSADSARMLDLIAALPAGPLRMSADFPGEVETSSSLGVAATDGGRLTLHCLSRSADDRAMPEVTLAIAAAGRLAGAEVELGREYPGWRPDLQSPVLATARSVHERLFGAEARISVTHGGLEAAIIAAKRPGIDALSFGPQIEGPHAPGERLHIGSAGRFMRLLAALADELSR